MKSLLQHTLNDLLPVDLMETYLDQVNLEVIDRPLS